jgi:hypothetical protein
MLLELSSNHECKYIRVTRDSQYNVMCLNLQHYEIPLIIVQDPAHVTENPTGKFKRDENYRSG